MCMDISFALPYTVVFVGVRVHGTLLVSPNFLGVFFTCFY
jgi:hypothetical protein